MIPTPEEWRGWLDQSVGKYFKEEVLKVKLEDLKDDWANGQFTADSAEATIQLNSEALGKTQAYADIILTLEEISTDDSSEDEENEDTTY